MSRIGPRLQLKASCEGCTHEHGEYYICQSDTGFKVYCKHPDSMNKNPVTGHGYIGDTTWDTPSWCPLLEDATLDLLTKKAAEVARRLAPELFPKAEVPAPPTDVNDVMESA